ncbi:hypothetical protein [Buchananella hordeovulneris]|uniref:hypothetical protein n=1 Tax=Buchananella hordeovulneris TaxID=52770 RepID=UPI000F6019C2|nr:hypothetical protein [Buchananella hordeovulneris]RRD41806.1 hypothetical protein EII13_10815 [Buchananella hordeovulneris]
MGVEWIMAPWAGKCFLSDLVYWMFCNGFLSSVKSIEWDEEAGFLYVCSGDGVRSLLVANGGFFINSAAACLVAENKISANRRLTDCNVAVPDFVTVCAEEGMDFNVKERIECFVSAIAFPVVAKPACGSLGHCVSIVNCIDELIIALSNIFDAGYGEALVESYISWPEYRIIVFEDEVQIAYAKDVVTIFGDGVHSKEELVRRQVGNSLAADLIVEGMSHDYGEVLDLGVRWSPSKIANLSLGGLAVDASDRVEQSWRELGKRVAEGLGLRLCAIDFFARGADIISDCVVIDVNSNPGFRHYALQGRREFTRVMRLVKKVVDGGCNNYSL